MQMCVKFQVQASSAITLIQSDIRTALKSAFGTSDGPLLVTDWCCGRSQSSDTGALGDAFSAESSASVSECRDSASNITLSGVEPVSPLQSAGASSLKGNVILVLLLSSTWLV